MNRESISVVMVCYNEGKLLQRALDSVFAQSDKDFELVVVKNASTCEETARICRELEGRPGVRVEWRATNDGNAVGRNHGFRVAAGDLLIPFDADDVLPPHVVATERAAFAGHPEADFVFGDYYLRNVETGEGRLIDCSALTDAQGWLDGRSFAQGRMFLGSSPCRRALWQRVGGYRGSMYGWQDVDFWMRVIASGARGLYVKSTLYEWYRSGSGVNSKTPPHRTWEVTLRNRKFQERYGDWAVTVEGFVNYASREYRNPQARRLMRRYGWRLPPIPRALWGLFLRASLKCLVPLALTNAMVRHQRGTGRSDVS